MAQPNRSRRREKVSLGPPAGLNRLRPCAALFSGWRVHRLARFSFTGGKQGNRENPRPKPALGTILTAQAQEGAEPKPSSSRNTRKTPTINQNFRSFGFVIQREFEVTSETKPASDLISLAVAARILAVCLFAALHRFQKSWEEQGGMLLEQGRHVHQHGAVSTGRAVRVNGSGYPRARNPIARERDEYGDAQL